MRSTKGRILCTEDDIDTRELIDFVLTRYGYEVVCSASNLQAQYESGSDLMRLRNRGFGLTGMIERVAMLNGKLSMQSSPGQGTTIRVELVAPERSREQHEDENEQ